MRLRDDIQIRLVEQYVSAYIRRYNKNILYNIEDMFTSFQRECLGWNTSVEMAYLSTAEV